MTRTLITATIITALLAGCTTTAPVGSTQKETPSPKDQTRMPWVPGESNSGFIRTWLVCGDFPSPTEDSVLFVKRHSIGLTTDYLAAGGGEAGLKPGAGMQVKRPDGSTTEWFSYTSPQDRVDFAPAIQTRESDRPVEEVVGYAYATINRDAAGKGYLSMGSDDGIRVWLNGKLVHDNQILRWITPDADIVPVSFKKGDNGLLVKVDQGVGGWNFALRALDASTLSALDAVDIRPKLDDEAKQLTVETDSGLGRIVPATAPLTIEVGAPGGRAVARKQVKRGATAVFDSNPWPDGPYEILVTQALYGGGFVRKPLLWYKGDLLAGISALLDRCSNLPKRPTTRQELQLQMLVDFMAARADGDPRTDPKALAGTVADPRKRAGLIAALIEYKEALMAEGADVRPNGFVRLAWRDEIDDSPQYARAYLPPGYDHGKKWPMIVSLHGYAAHNPPYVQWWGSERRHHSVSLEFPVIVLEPHGRGNTSYRGIGDMDVLRAIKLAKEKFNVDEDRVYLTGYSMGGGGTWHVGTRHPELFAAIAPVYGGWDYRGWIDEDDLAKKTERELFHLESWSSFAQAEALLTTPLLISHGSKDDLVNVDYSRYATRMMQQWPGYSIRYREHPGKGHSLPGCESEIVPWMLRHTRNDRPKRVRVRSARLETAAAHWVRVEQRDDPFAFIHVDAEVTGPNTIKLRTENVLQIALSPGGKLVNTRQPVRVIWNGRNTGTHRYAKGGVSLRADGYIPGQVFKTPRIEGPADNLTTTPFAIVLGTASKDPAMRRFCEHHAERKRDSWEEWQHHKPRYFLDTEVTDEVMRNYSLHLFGGPSDNLVTRKLMKSIPLAISPGGFSINGCEVTAKDGAVSLTYPNPLNRDRYVVVVAANSATGMFFADRLNYGADYAVADARGGVISGVFDKHWRFQEEYTDAPKPEDRAESIPRKAPAHFSCNVPANKLMLSQVLETRSSGSFKHVQRDIGSNGKPIVLDGKTYDSGIASGIARGQVSRLIHDLSGGNWKRLRGVAGIYIENPGELEEKNKGATRVILAVYGDGKELYKAPTFRWDSKPVDFDVNIEGVRELELQVSNAGTWHYKVDSVNWADIRLEK